MTKVDLLKILDAMDACKPALKWICYTNGTAKQIYEKYEDMEWLEWLYEELDLDYEIHFFDELEEMLDGQEQEDIQVLKHIIPEIRLCWDDVEQALINYWENLE